MTSYAGSELELFAQARRWKTYVRDRLAAHLRGRVLEVGAGIGGFTEVLAPLAPAGWCCLEPDPRLLATIAQRRAAEPVFSRMRIFPGVLPALPAGEVFDTILYLDVLEHIADDRSELAAAAERLAPGGRLVVLGPAFQTVYSPFDAAIGHYRRYTRAGLRRLRPAGLAEMAAFYLHAPGLLLSLGNRLLLRRFSPQPAQIAFWDRFVVPAARRLDPLFGHRFGRSVVIVWRRA